jgi:hypothetical protein
VNGQHVQQNVMVAILQEKEVSLKEQHGVVNHVVKQFNQKNVKLILVTNNVNYILNFI